MEKIAIIDLGSNTARLLIVNVNENGNFQIVDQLKEAPRLGKDMEKDGFLKPQAIQDTIKTLKMFRKLCDANGVEKIIAVATAAVRHAKNQRSAARILARNRFHYQAPSARSVRTIFSAYLGLLVLHVPDWQSCLSGNASPRKSDMGSQFVVRSRWNFRLRNRTRRSGAIPVACL